MNNKTKVCSRCQEEKSVAEFYSDKRNTDGLYADCSTCHSAKATLPVSIIYGVYSKHHKAIVYCGESLQGLGVRISKHKNSAFRNGSLYKYHQAIKKYGTANFEYTILSDTYDETQTEAYFISMLSPRYNMKSGNKTRQTRFRTKAELNEYLQGVA